LQFVRNSETQTNGTKTPSCNRLVNAANAERAATTQKQALITIYQAVIPRNIF
jgi:hypothetical protein